MTNDKSITIRIPKTVEDALRRVAIKDNRKPADLARIAILEFLRDRGQDV